MMSDSLALRAAVTTQTLFTQRWISSISLISIKGLTEEQDKSNSAVILYTPCPSAPQPARLLLRLDPQYSQLTHIPSPVPGGFTGTYSTRYSTPASEPSALYVRNFVLEAVKVLDASPSPDFFLSSPFFAR